MYLIKGAQVYTENGLKKLDVRIENDRIIEIGQDLELNLISGEEEVMAYGKYLLPGAIDIHVHFRDPGNPEKEDFKTGTEAALAGGVTFICDMPNTNPSTTNKAGLEAKREAAKKAKCNTKFWLGATYNNLDEIKELIKEPDVIGVKAYLGSSTGNLLFDNEEYWDKLFSIPGIQVAVHAEKESIIQENNLKFKDIEDPEIHSVIRSNDAAEAATRRACEIGFKYNTKLHIAHMSTSEELVVIKEYKEKGYTNLTCEVCPHHLIFHIGDYHEYKNFLRVNPPIRSKEDRKALWDDGIGLGLVDMISTDHAPHTVEEKDCNYHVAHSGMPGVQECSSLMLNAIHLGKITLDDFVRLRSTNPAKIFNLEGRGVIKEGNFADLMLIDLDADFEIKLEDLKSKCGWSNYVGRKGKGVIEKVWCNGKLA
jgi:dihydroorotase